MHLSMIARKNLMLFLFLSNVFFAFAQLDTIHYLPPLYANTIVDKDFGEQYVVLSTNESVPFTVTMFNNAGRSQQVQISKSQPQIVDLGYQQAAWGVVEKSSLNTVLDDDGMVLVAEKPFFVNERHLSTVQGLMLTTKGKVAAGLDFYTGHIYTVYGENTRPRNHFVSIMATENNTQITISNPDAKYLDHANNSFTITLNQYQSYVIADEINLHTWTGSAYDAANIVSANAINGSHITSDKPVVVNTGSWLGGGSSTVQDIGGDQIVPVEYVGKEYAINKGRGSSLNEKALVVATANNTIISVNGAVVATLTIAGDHIFLDDSYFTASGLMYVESSEPVYIYQTLGADNSDAAIGMSFIPPLNCMANTKVNIPYATQMISNVDMADPNGNSPILSLVTKDGSNFTVNGTDISTIISGYPNNSGPNTIAGTDWVSYTISDFNFTGFTPTGDWNLEIDAEHAINASLSVRDDLIGAGCYFSGFGDDPILTKEPIIVGGTACYPNNAILRASGFPSYEWQLGTTIISGESADSLVVNDLGFYRVRGVTTCDGATVTSKFSEYVEINPCVSINDITITEPSAIQDVTFTVTLGTVYAQDVSFSYETVAGTADLNKDFLGKQGVITIPAGSTQATINVTLLSDEIDEYDEQFTVELTDPVNCDFSIPVGTCTILDNDNPPSYSFASSSISVQEGTNLFAVFEINLDKVSEKETWVLYETSDISANAGQDYTAEKDTLFFAPGITTGTISIPILDDDIYEFPEQFNLSIIGAGNLTYISAYNELALITDDDSQVFFSVADTQAVEGNDMNFWISINKSYGIDLDIDYATQDDQATVADNDYTPVSGTVTIPAGTTAVKISVPTGDDEIDEDNETFKFILSNLPSPHGLFLKPSANGLIIDDDCTPIAVTDAFTTPEETLLTGVSVLDNDQELCDSPLVLSLLKLPDHAQTFNFDTQDGEIEYESVLNFFGTDTIEYSMTDADGQVSQAIAVITVTNVNDVPVAVDTALTIDEDQVLVFSPLENDLDIDLSGLSLVSISAVSNATVTIDANGTDLHFTPAQDFNGVITFDYTMEDGEGDQATATITITLNPVNDNPGAVNDYVTTDEDSLSVAFDPLLNDYDADNSGLSMVSIGLPVNGTIIPQGDGTYKYQPDPNFNGTDSVTYIVQDGEGDQSTGKIYFTVNPVNDPPVAALENRITQEDTPINIKVLDNDSDVDGNLSPSGVTITQNPTHGTVVVEADGSVTYTPDANYFGQDNFYYKLIDDAGAESNTVMDRILVFPVDDMPIAVNDTVTTMEDSASPLVITPMANDSDPDNSGLILSIVTQPVNGTATLSGANITYTSNANYYGMDSILYQIKEVGAGQGTAQAYIIITVTPVNDIPVANDDIATVLEDNSVDVDVLNNDEDPDAMGLTVVSVSTPGNGTATIVGNQVHYVPDPDYFGADLFTYTIEDAQGDQATASVSITVDPDDSDVPTAINDLVTTDEDVSVDINPVLNDLDPDLSGLTMSVVTAPLHGNITSITGNVITYEPSPNYNGQDTIVYQIQENAAGGSTDQGLIIITITPVNDIPVANDDNYTIDEDVASDFDVMANDEDPDFNGITIVSVSAPAHGAATIVSGQIHYVPDADYNGSDSFTYTIEDYNGDQATATVSVTINADDTDAPVPADDTVTTDEDVAVIISPLANDYDPDGTGLTISVITAPDSGTYVISGSDITYTPNANFNGLDSIQYQVEEVGANNQTATSWIHITVTPVNDLPDAIDDTETVLEDNSINIDPLVNDLDPDRGGLTITHITGPVNGTGSINAGLTIDYTPNADFFGLDSIIYTIADMDGDLDSAVIRITVTADDTDVPVATDDNVVTDEDVPVVISPLANDYDPDLTGLTISIITAPDSGSVVISGSDITYTPNANFNGLDSIQYQVEEVGANNQTATAWIHITVTPVNDLPDAVDDTETVLEDNSINIDPLVNDLDPDHGGLTITHITGPVNGTGSINAGLTIDYTPNSDFFGLDSIIYTIADIDGDLDSAVIRITVTADDTDAPDAVKDIFEFNEDESGVVQPMANDYDPDRSGLIMTLISAPDSGQFINQGDTAFLYIPPANYNGTDTAVYQIQEVAAGMQIDIDTMIFIVYAVNDTPVAVIDSLILDEDTQDSVYVLLNDLDPDYSGIKVVDVVSTPNALTEISSDSTYIRYTPVADFFGTDSVLYYIADGEGDLDSAYIRVIVTADTTDVPVANDDLVVINEDMSIDIAPLANDYDPDLSGLILTILDGPNDGTYILHNDTVTYTPDPNFNGRDTIFYQIQETGAGQSTATAYIYIQIDTINERPIANPDYVNIFEDTSDTIWVLVNDIDLDWEGIIVDSVSLSDTAIVELTPDSTGVIYTPSANFYGADSVFYILRDGQGDLDTAWIYINVVAVNDTPHAQNDVILINEDESGSVNILANDEDPDRQGVDITVGIPVQNGSVTIDPNGDVVYTPDADYFGSDSLMYYITDKENDVDSAWIYITITAVNDTPVVVNDNAIMLEETVTDIPILINDYDAEGSIPLDSIFIAFTTNNGDAVLLPGTGVIRYTPVVNFYGLDSLGYYVKDNEGLASDTAYVYITVMNVNDIPVATDDTVNIPEDFSAVIAILDNDEDPDHAGLAVTLISGPANGTANLVNDTVYYTPNANFFGNDTIRYIIVDDGNDTVEAKVLITVESVNDLPVANDDYVSILEETTVDIPVLVNDNDVEAAIPLDSVFIVSTTNHGVATLILGTGVINYVPEVNFFGNDTLTYYVKDTDGAMSDTATVVINVQNVNENPDAVDDYYYLPEDSVIDLMILVNDLDADMSGLSLDSISDPFHGTLVMDKAPDTIRYVPEPNYFGLDSIKYFIADGENDLDSAWIYIEIYPVNDEPVAVNDTIIISDLDGDTLAILANDYDVETILTGNHVVIEVLPTMGSAYIDFETGELIYTMDVDFYYSDSLTYVITDDDGASDTAMVFIFDRDSILDSDDDGIPNLVEGNEDMVDMDGIPNYLDLDSDGDQIPDAIEGLLDRDGNGIEDYIDPFDWDADSDGDGLPNRYEDTNNDGNPYNDDCDGDGVVNYLDATDNCEDYLDIPNGFSPNGDGINDLFYIEGLWNFPDAEIYIFNRWGNRVFDMKYYGDEDRYGPYDAWWNGQTNRIGKADVPEGVYFYRLTLGRGRKVKEGYIHLRR